LYNIFRPISSFFTMPPIVQQPVVKFVLVVFYFVNEQPPTSTVRLPEATPDREDGWPADAATATPSDRSRSSQ
jgi:hypothetical protein